MAEFLYEDGGVYLQSGTRYARVYLPSGETTYVLGTTEDKDLRSIFHLTRVVSVSRHKLVVTGHSYLLSHVLDANTTLYATVTPRDKIVSETTQSEYDHNTIYFRAVNPNVKLHTLVHVGFTPYHTTTDDLLVYANDVDQKVTTDGTYKMTFIHRHRGIAGKPVAITENGTHSAHPDDYHPWVVELA